MIALIKKHIRSLSIWAFLLGFSFTIFLVAIAWRDTVEQQKKIFAADAANVSNEISQKLNTVEEVLASLAILISSAHYVDRDQFRIFSEKVLVIVEVLSGENELYKK